MAVYWCLDLNRPSLVSNKTMSIINSQPPDLDQMFSDTDRKKEQPRFQTAARNQSDSVLQQKIQNCWSLTLSTDKNEKKKLCFVELFTNICTISLCIYNFVYSFTKCWTWSGICTLPATDEKLSNFHLTRRLHAVRRKHNSAHVINFVKGLKCVSLCSRPER